MVPIITEPSMIRDAGDSLRQGVFYLKIPESCVPFVEAGRKFAYSFTDNDKCKEYSDGHFGGYHDRKHNQIESFYIEQREWQRQLSTDLQELANQMHLLARKVLSELLSAAKIPEELWSEATGGVTLEQGQVHFSYNHYRPEKAVSGIDEHRDFGHISILYVEKPGLEAFLDKKWTAIDPKEGHFVALIGREFEILINDSNKFSACLHRVGQLSEERVSFAITYDNGRDTPVMRYNKEEKKLEIVFADDKSYLESCFKELYSTNENNND
jgi:isopenicillin N synthase-like dioxygenase